MLALVLTSFGAGAGAQAPQFAAPLDTFDFQGELRGSGDADARAGAVRPTAAQASIVADLQAQVRWNHFGTPASLIRHGAALTSGLGGDAVTVARSWLRANRALFRLSEQGVADLELLVDAPIGSGHAITFRQRFGGLPAATDGLVSLAVSGGSVVYASSSIAPDAALTGAATLSPEQAFSTAAAAAGRRVDAAKVKVAGTQGAWTRLQVEGLAQPQFTRLAALPTPTDGVRLVHDNIVADTASAVPVAVRELVDAATGKVWVRENLVDHAQAPNAVDDPEWAVFPSNPRLDYSSADIRELWCHEDTPGCDLAVNNSAIRVPWDVDTATGQSTNTTRGNAAETFEKWNSNNNRDIGTVPATPRPDRRYVYPWTNQWFEERCNPAVFTSPQRNDIDAALANLFAMHNRMHDWSYRLGFTERTWNLQNDNFGLGEDGGDPETGNAQAGGVVGGAPTFPSRDNANQFTPPDGQRPITNMFLWQPIAGGFYAPCVDGDYDMSVIGHEYTHAITNRMVAGPDTGISGAQGGAMGESWSDQFAMEYLQEYDFVRPEQDNPYAVGAYVTGDERAAIRNYGMNFSPLNYSDIGYDLVGVQVHADGEIWSAASFDVRRRMIEKYDRRFPARDERLQRRCADGEVPLDRCPGNRRWIQLHFDSLLLMQSAVSMVDARDAILASDFVRFGGAHQKEIWDGYASRGLGETALSEGNSDPDPVPSFSSPFSREGTLLLRPFDLRGNTVQGARLFIGDFEARAVPVADTDPATPLGDRVDLVPGRYNLLVQAPGHGARRAEVTIRSGDTTRPVLFLPENLASSANGATASGDGINQGFLIDDTEATNWASLGAPVAGRKVTVRLDPSRPWHLISRVQVSAQLRPPDPQDPGGDTGAQNRFSALRQFEIWTCTIRTGVDCTSDSQFRRAFTSPADAFPSVQPRPRSPELKLDSFRIPPTIASVVQLRVLHNQCTGAPDYQGDQDDDPNNVTDCSDASPQAQNVRAAELQVFNL